MSNTSGISPTSGINPLARQCGEITARKLFAARGNHSEIHLSEHELALAASAAAQVAMTQQLANLRKARKEIDDEI